MIFLIDTCFWNHSFRLFQEKILDIRPLILKYNLGITDAVIAEIKHFNLDSYVPLNQIYIIPISDSEFDHSYKDISYLDREDQTLIVSYDKIASDTPVILTDDGALFAECLQTNRTALLLPLFLLSLVRHNLVSKNAIAKCLRYWEETGAYKLKEIKKWTQELQDIK